MNWRTSFRSRGTIGNSITSSIGQKIEIKDGNILNISVMALQLMNGSSGMENDVNESLKFILNENYLKQCMDAR